MMKSNPYGILLNNTLMVEIDDSADENFVNFAKEMLGRIVFATAGFYREIDKNDFVTYIKLDKDNILSVYVKESECYIGVINNRTQSLSTRTTFDILTKINNKSIDDYIKKLCLSEDYYRRNGKLPLNMQNKPVVEKWNEIIELRKIDKLSEPTKLAEILRQNGENLSKQFWDNVKDINSSQIKMTIIPETIKEKEDR